jgi:hypothetical protein
MKIQYAQEILNLLGQPFHLTTELEFASNTQEMLCILHSQYPRRFCI